MKEWLKGGLIGFLLFFVGLWIFMLVTGSDAQGWKCTTLSSPEYCSFSSFFFSPIHWGFVIFFSLVGFGGGAIDIIIFKKTLYNPQIPHEKKYLKITSTIVLTLIIVIGLVGILAFENWAGTMIYVLIFAIFAMFVSWFIGKKKYGL